MRENTTNNNNSDSFYEETTSNTTTNSAGMKRPHSLDFNTGKPGKRRPHLLPVLDSPDIQKLGLATPDIDKFLINANSGVLQTPSGIGYTPKVTTEQEEFSKGFEQALNNLHKNETSNIPSNNNNNTSNNNTPATKLSTSSTVTNTMSGGGITYTNLDNTFPVTQIKEEPQTVPQSPPLSPIDMENQERIKLERKRMRNRVAASKCRKRKLERISKLEDKVKNLKGENAELGAVIAGLKQHVFKLKQQVIEHVKSGCRVDLPGQI